MELIDSLDVGDSVVELLRGDLTKMAKRDRVDLLVLSAFPNDYVPTQTSLIGALDRRGLSVADLATSKEEDLREDFSCWLSKKFRSPDPGIGYDRILCFEPLSRGNPPELVGDIYRALVPILGRERGIRSIAMPVLAAGDQLFSIEDMLPPLLEATIHWLESGLPIERVKIVAHAKPVAERARAVFERQKRSYVPTESKAKSGEFDVFISYAHENTKEMQEFEYHLLELVPHVRIFVDRKSIDVGTPWQPEIFESLDLCRRVVPLFSPDYLRSRVCKEEFNIAWVRSRESENEILFPVYLFSANLPTYMRYRKYFDCREGSSSKLKQASARLLQDLNLR